MASIQSYANLAVSWGLFVLIWLVQLIIYPGFHRISPEDFPAYHKWYAKRISYIVLPLMITELVIAADWVIEDSYSIISVFSICLIFIVWLSTFTLQVPIHSRLKTGKSDELIWRLVKTNWIRTVAWSVKTGVLTINVFRGFIH
jgi:hypothetical protein